MLNSDSLRCFRPFLIFEHAEFLLRLIGLYPEDSCLCRQKCRAFHMRRAPGHHRNDIIVLIMAKPNSVFFFVIFGNISHFNFVKLKFYNAWLASFK